MAAIDYSASHPQNFKIGEVQSEGTAISLVSCLDAPRFFFFEFEDRLW
jgi:hypothetical protein